MPFHILSVFPKKFQVRTVPHVQTFERPLHQLSGGVKSALLEVEFSKLDPHVLVPTVFLHQRVKQVFPFL